MVIQLRQQDILHLVIKGSLFSATFLGESSCHVSRWSPEVGNGLVQDIIISWSGSVLLGHHQPNGVGNFIHDSVAGFLLIECGA
jgi:hypothetical protein